MPDPDRPPSDRGAAGAGGPAVERSDEYRHAAGGDPLWAESWYFDWAAADGRLGGYVRLDLRPHQGRAWYWACLVGEDRPLVTVIDHDVPLPRTGLEVRSEGLWADHNVETPLDHWSLSCESFAVEVDDPTEVYGDLRGRRLPFGFDLEWETDGSPYPYPGVDRYEVPCRVTGEVLVGQERIEVDGPGQRDHSWGARDWWTYGWSWTSATLGDGTRVHGTHVTLGADDLYSTGYLQHPDTGLVPGMVSDRDQRLGPEGLPTDGTLTVGPTGTDGPGGPAVRLAVEPVAFSPVHLVAPDGRRSRFPRALCRYTAGDGRTGVGWTEWNQPG